MKRDFKKNRLLNQKGAAIVEAAVVFPLVIMAVMAVIYILVFLYSQTALQSKIHISLRAEMGKQTETIYTYRNVDGDIYMYDDASSTPSRYYGEGQLSFAGRGLLSEGFVKPLDAVVYAVDEKKYIRYADLLKQ